MAFSKLLYDRELAISERKVKPADITHNSSVILGKQVIHILPEGYCPAHEASTIVRANAGLRSATLNPDRKPFCIDHLRTSVQLPIQLNQTNPVQIELLRIDLNTLQNETITISSSAIKKLQKAANKQNKRKGPNDAELLHYSVKKTGLYLLQSVLDESKLDVQRTVADTVVAQCPASSCDAYEST